MPIFKAFKPSDHQPQPQPPSPHQQPHTSPLESTRAMPEEPQRKGLLGRLRNLQLARPDPRPEILPDHDPEPVDPDAAAKAARREARREQRRNREEEWNEEYRQRRNFAIEVGVEMRPLTPLSDFDSASEDERLPASQKPPPAQIYAPSQTHAPQVKPHVGEGLIPPASPSPSYHDTIQPDNDHSQPTQLIHDAPNPAQLPQPLEKADAPRDPKEDAQLAEMFAAQAYNTASSSIPLAPQSNASGSYSAPQPHQRQPSPIGWGGVYHSVPSQPMYGTPAHLAPVPRTVRDIDPILANNIRRGRELAMLAIEQEERGNLGAAEGGYIKALSLLVPASKKLDDGSELNKNARMQQKAKIKREAAAMLDRCEELRLFLRANGPAVPSEMPVMPNATSTKKPAFCLRKRGSLGAPPSRNLPPTPKNQPPATSSSQPQTRSDRNSTLPMSPPPPPRHLQEGHGRSHLLNRLTSRKDVLASASTVIPPDTSRQLPPSDPPPMDYKQRRPHRADEKCFMCSAPAHLRTRCGHTYCSNCGNQAVSVFGQCPVPDCGAQIAVEDFEHIL